MPSAPNSRALAASSACRRSRAPQAAQLVGPLEDRLEVLVDARRHERHLADDDAARAAVDRDHVALAQLVPADADGLRAGVDVEAVAAGDARLAHAARDDRRVRGHAAVRGEDALRLDQAVDVVGRRLPADEDDRLAGLAALLGAVGVEHDLAAGRARRGVEPLRGDLELGVRVEARVQQLVELAGSIRATASSRSISPSAAMSTAHLIAAAAVRFAVRVCRR